MSAANVLGFEARPPRTRAGREKSGSSSESAPSGDEFETEFDCHAGMWRIADAHNATLACVGTAVLVTCAAILAQLDYGAVMGRYSGYI